MSPNLIADQWMAGAGIRGRYKIKTCMLACQISHKSWVRQDQLCHLAFIVYIRTNTSKILKFFVFKIQKKYD